MPTQEAQSSIVLYIDEDISPRLTEALRQRSYDALSAYDVRLISIPDAEHLAFAAQSGRVLLTCNAKDFAPLYDLRWEEGRQHAGIVVSQQLEFGEMLRRVVRMLDSRTADQMRNTYRNLAEFVARGDSDVEVPGA